jgi:hypothetical protein
MLHWVLVTTNRTSRSNKPTEPYEICFQNFTVSVEDRAQTQHVALGATTNKTKKGPLESGFKHSLPSRESREIERLTVNCQCLTVNVSRLV